MICKTCNADVHPQPNRVSVACCVRCNAEIQGFRGFDDLYTCGSCSFAGRARVETRFIHKCPAANCGARMPTPDEVVDEARAVLLPDEISIETAEAKLVRPIAKVAPRGQPVDVIDQVRERLQFVRERIAELRAFEKEERRLDRMLSVIDADDMAAE